MSDDRVSLGNTLATVLAGLFFVAVAVGLLWTGSQNAETAEERIDNAVEIEAEVLESEVYSERRAGERKYFVDVRFAYTYDGESYESTRITPADESRIYDSRSPARSAVDDYPEGETVTGYVDPSHPDEAFLEKTEGLPSVVRYAFSAALAVVGLALAGWGIRRRVR